MAYTLEQLNRDTSLYFGGGALEARPGHLCKGGSSKAAINYQREQDAENKRRILAATNAINSIFDNARREGPYAQQRNAVYQLNADEVNRQAAEAERANRFALARAGLLGGSADVESVGDINDRTNKGLLRAQGIADDSAASLKTRDENTRQSLLSLANQGIDANAASTMATNQLNSNLSGAASDKAAASVGSLFNDMAQAYLTGTAANQAANTLARQQALYQKVYGVSDPHITYSGS